MAIRYELSETPKGPVRSFTVDEVDEAAKFWLDHAKGMPVRVAGGSEGWGYGLPHEVKPLLDAVARLQESRARKGDK